MFQSKEAERLRKGIDYLEQFLGSASDGADWKGKQIASDLKLETRLRQTKEQLARVEAPQYLKSLEGSLGVDPAIYQCPGNNYDRPLRAARLV
ncbi:hypothetical protein T484DRAFT_2907538 [Baffinella frigidus]|nr:hypothetical protein T484DRAFT_2907538 [Cryptophyta sp. CCMP2293]